MEHGNWYMVFPCDFCLQIHTFDTQLGGCKQPQYIPHVHSALIVIVVSTERRSQYKSIPFGNFGVGILKLSRYKMRRSLVTRRMRCCNSSAVNSFGPGITNDRRTFSNRYLEIYIFIDKLIVHNIRHT